MVTDLSNVIFGILLGMLIGGLLFAGISLSGSTIKGDAYATNLCTKMGYGSGTIECHDIGDRNPTSWDSCSIVCNGIVVSTATNGDVK